MSERVDYSRDGGAHQVRLSVFRIGEKDLAVLRKNAAYAERLLPSLLERLHPRFAPWPSVQAALMRPDVHKLRLEHWTRAASGRLVDGFEDSARRLARAFYDNGIPGYAVAICHHTVLGAVMEEAGLDDAPARGLSALLKGRGGDDKAALRDALRKATWCSLEILLETYAEAERETRTATLRRLADDFERNVKGIVESTASAATQMQSNARRMSQIAADTNRRAMEVGSAAEQSLGNVQTIASASEQMSGSIAEISRNVGQSSQIANAAVEEASRTNTAVAGLGEAAQRIGAVVDLIRAIASQTNLLALNATIEAARAGEAGKGFAVVAQEVKSLANQTAKATEDIAAQIAEMQGAAGQSAEAIKGVGGTITRINEIVTTIAAAVEEQTAATQEIARNAQQTASGTHEAVRSIGDVTKASGETGGIAGEVLRTAELLQSQAAALNQGVDTFLRNIRSA